jgi:DNA-binding PadR family transcriptional regulator
MKLKPQQTEILKLLYRFRFLNRPQIQHLLSHKHHSRTLIWLNELVKEEYIKRYYEKSIQSIPAIYSIAPRGRKYLRTHREETKAKDQVLRRVWREGKFSEQFRDKCLTIAEAYISLLDQRKEGVELNFLTNAELKEYGHLPQPLPDAYFTAVKNSKKERFFVEVFGDIPPRIMRRQVNKYFDYYDTEEWQENVTKDFPRVVLICPNFRLQTHIDRYIKRKMESSYFTPDLKFYLISEDLVRTQGLNSQTLSQVKT